MAEMKRDRRTREASGVHLARQHHRHLSLALSTILYLSTPHLLQVPLHVIQFPFHNPQATAPSAHLLSGSSITIRCYTAPLSCQDVMASLRISTTQLPTLCGSGCIANKPTCSVSALPTTLAPGVFHRNARISSSLACGAVSTKSVNAVENYRPGESPMPPPVTTPQTPQPGPSGIPGPGSPPFPGTTPTPVPSPGPGPTPGSPPGPPTPGGVLGGVPNFPGPGMPL